MRPGSLPTPRPSRPGQPTPARPRRRPDLTLPLPLPQHNLTSLAVPLPLPPPSAPASFSAPGGPQPAAATSAPPQTPALADLERVRRVGCGNGGTVWMVRDRPTGLIYALKVIHGHHDDAARHRICREIKILRTADHPHVVRCHGFYDRAGDIQILLEYMDGGSLDGRHIASEPVLANIARQVLSGLAYLHGRRIVHRDIKPSNLLINAAHQVKIADFGVGRILDQTIDQVNSSVGTIAYMSPERINTEINEGFYDGYLADIWSFGVSMLEFYLGRIPFGEQLGRQAGDWASLMCAICYSNPPEPPPTASPEFRSFIACCLQMEPRRRLPAARLLRHPFISQADVPAGGTISL